MTKNEKNRTKESSVSFVSYVALLFSIIACVLFVILLIKGGTKKENYDVSMMNEVGVMDVLNMFDDDKTYVLYIGREDCDICEDILPALQQAQKDMNFVTQYMDIYKIDRKSDEWKDLADLFDVTTTQSITADGKGEQVTETFGYFLDTKGFTPCVMVIKDGKQVAGFFGSKNVSDYKNWLKNNGV